MLIQERVELSKQIKMLDREIRKEMETFLNLDREAERRLMLSLKTERL